MSIPQVRRVISSRARTEKGREHEEIWLCRPLCPRIIASRPAQRGLPRAWRGQEVFCEDQKYRIHGYCDGSLYVKPNGRQDQPAAGFWALEFKTTAATEFDVVR